MLTSSGFEGRDTLIFFFHLRLELKLSKCSMVPWKEVVVGDERGLYCEKREILLANFEFLQRFPTDSQVDTFRLLKFFFF